MSKGGQLPGVADILARSPVQRAASTLIGFLGLKSAGVGPGRLLYEIRPTVDLTDYWEADAGARQRQQLAALGPFTAGNQSTAVLASPPAGEAWRIKEAGLVSGSLATPPTRVRGWWATHRNALEIAPDTGLPLYWFDYVPSPSANTHHCITFNRTPIWLLAGQVLRIHFVVDGASNPQYSPFLNFVRYPI